MRCWPRSLWSTSWTEREARVAFASRAWEAFRKLDDLRNGLVVDVYIYASHTEGPPVLQATWHARDVGHVDSINGAHPAGMRYRPPSTVKYPTDNQGHWAIFWEVEALRELPESIAHRASKSDRVTTRSSGRASRAAQCER